MSARLSDATREERGASKSRLLKVECPECGVILRGSASALRESGLPFCGCGARFEVPAVASLERVDPDAYQSLVDSLPDLSANHLMRLQGYDIRPTTKRHGTPQCSKRGCKRLRVPLERHCQPCLDAESVPF